MFASMVLVFSVDVECGLSQLPVGATRFGTLELLACDQKGSYLKKMTKIAR